MKLKIFDYSLKEKYFYDYFNSLKKNFKLDKRNLDI
jgi:hypothetical protein